MPWGKNDVESHNKGLSDKQKEVWVKVANSALKRCESEGGEDCDASAIKQANAAVSRMDASKYIGLKEIDKDGNKRDIDDFNDVEFKSLYSDKGIDALVSGDKTIEYFFNREKPYSWDEGTLADWVGKRFGFMQFAASKGIEYLDDDKLPANVVSARERLKSPNGGEPFIRRMALKVGKFTIGGGKKVFFTNEFYDKWGPQFANKPIFKGHQGAGTAEDRVRLGIILAYHKVNGDPYFWLYLRDKDTIELIRDYERLGISSDED